LTTDPDTVRAPDVAFVRRDRLPAGDAVERYFVGAPDLAVEVISPQAGGIDRMCVQPGTLEPFESADLYAKASGFLVEMKVDIGSRVTEKDVLARLADPT